MANFSPPLQYSRRQVNAEYISAGGASRFVRRPGARRAIESVIPEDVTTKEPLSRDPETRARVITYYTCETVYLANARGSSFHQTTVEELRVFHLGIPRHQLFSTNHAEMQFVCPRSTAIIAINYIGPYKILPDYPRF